MKTKSLIYYALISSIFLFSLVSIWKILVTLQGVELKNLNFAIIITLGIFISLLNLLIGEKLNYLIIGDKPTKNKVDNAKNLKINVIDQAEFMRMLNKTS